MKRPGSVNTAAPPHPYGIGIPRAIPSISVGGCSRCTPERSGRFCHPVRHSAFDIVLRSLRVSFLIARIEGQSWRISTCWIPSWMPPRSRYRDYESRGDSWPMSLQHTMAQGVDQEPTRVLAHVFNVHSQSGGSHNGRRNREDLHRRLIGLALQSTRRSDESHGDE